LSFRRLAPYLLLVAVAVAVVSFADQFPSSMPTQWDASGKPSRFSPRSGFGIVSPILIWTFLLILLDRLLTYRGRRPLFSPQLARALESMRWLFPVIATAYAFAPVWGGTPIRISYGLMFAVPLLIEFVRVSSGKDGGWLASAYVNPADSRLLVPDAEGWRLNYARPAARVLAIVIAVLIGLAVVAVRARLRGP
jgi:uncharacterized protein DUF1648